MKLHTKLLVSFGSLWLLFLTAIIVATAVIEQYGQSLETAYHNNINSVRYCEQMKSVLDGYNQIAMTALWHKKMPQTDEIQKLQELFEDAKIGQSQIITLPGEKDLSYRIFDMIADYQIEFGKFIALPPDDRPQFYRQSLLPRFYKTQSTAEDISQLNLNHLREVDARMRNNLWITRIVQVLFVILGTVLAFASVIILSRIILTPLKTLMSSAHRIEAGDLDLTIPVQSQDELGQLAGAFNSMASRLREYRQLNHVKLLRTQQTTQQAIDSMLDAVAVFNPAGEVEIANHQARIHFGLVPGQSDPADRPRWLTDLINQVITTGKPVEPQGYESAVQLFDADEERFLLPRAVPMFGEKRAVIGVAVTLVDVTRLRRADELKSGLLATVSHELKTPLTAARFSVQLLAQETLAPLNERQRKLVSAACEGTDRLHRIIETLLRLHRIEEGQQPVQLSAMSPQTIIQQATDAFGDDFRQKGLTLKTNAPADLPQVQADPELIGYVLTNLLSNALKFVPAPGEVAILAAADGDHVIFTVRDTGPGIPPEHVPQLFTRFYRANASSETAGVGLGLAIARQLIEAHGGTIRYVQEPGTTGACFTFTLVTAAK